jgi:DNA polymerase I
MAQKRLEEFSKPSETLTIKPKEPQPSSTQASSPSFMEMIEKEKERIKKRFAAPENLPPTYFVSATYDGRREATCVKLYEPVSERIYFWHDNTGHKPYLLTNLSPIELEKITRLTSHQGFDHFELTKKFDPLLDKQVTVTKVVAKDPLAVGGRPTGCMRDIIPEDAPAILGIERESVKVWEDHIKYYQCYIYDYNLEPGMLYEVEKGNLAPARFEPSEEMVKKTLQLFKAESDEEISHVDRWARLLEYPAPKFRRVALDIEVISPVPTRVPDPREAACPIICVSLYGSDGVKRVLLLQREGVREGGERLSADVNLEFYDTEEKLIRAVFDVLWTYPFVITFNGDDFDFRYLAHRALNLGFRKSEIPIEVGHRVCLLHYGVHVDLYKFFYNRSIQIYAFSNRYRDVTLDDVGKALINLRKIELENSLGELTYTELANYCLRDAEIAFKLTSFDDNLTMKLILALARVSHMPMEDVSRQGVSRWIRNFMHAEHRRRGWLIPNTEDIIAVKGKTATTAIIKGKKYKGAIVVEPVPGVHFNVAVMDFPSLYPSIIKVWNLGYQSILCQHEECRSNKVPDTPHWVCTKKRALESLQIGSLRDLRVFWYKPKSKDKQLPKEQRSWYDVIQSALKVILNASYGVFGAESFDLYCPPVAEATASIGRHSITLIINKARELGIDVIYGDTDSVFLKNPSEQQINELAKWSEHELKMSLDVDKVYRYAVFSRRKKNYLGVLEDGSVDVKGMTGKKKHIPLFIKDAFDLMKQRLAQVKTPADFDKAKKDIRVIVLDCYMRLKRREWHSLNDLAFHVVLGETPKAYTKTTPQHVKAALILEKQRNIELKAGDLISFVKVTKEPHVKPLELAIDSEIDVDKYVGYLHSTFDQVLDALGLEFDEIIGLTRLERFM